jgi:hypothetical protein
MIFVNTNQLPNQTLLVLLLALLTANATVFSTVRGELARVSAQLGPDFEMTAAETDLTLLQDAWVGTFLSFKSLNGFGGSVTLWMSDSWPNGLAGPIGPFLSDGPVNLAPGSSENVTARWISYDSYSRWSDPGVYYYNVTGVSQGHSHTVLFRITVIVRPYFIVSVPVHNITIQAGTSQSTIVAVTARNGFSSRIALGGSAFDTPHGGITARGESLVSGSGNTNLTISVDRSVPPGNYTLVVEGWPEDSPNSFENNTSVMIHVLSPAPQTSSLFGIPLKSLLVSTTALALGAVLVVLSFLFLRRRLKHSSAVEKREEETNQP